MFRRKKKLQEMEMDILSLFIVVGHFGDILAEIDERLEDTEYAEDTNITEDDYGCNTIFEFYDEPDKYEEIKIWLGRQIDFAWQTRRNAMANAFEFTLDFIHQLESRTF